MELVLMRSMHIYMESSLGGFWQGSSAVRAIVGVEWSSMQALVGSDSSQMKSMSMQCGITYFKWLSVKKGCAIVIINLARPGNNHCD